MKKETIEKLFKRYISIFDDVVNLTTGEHLDDSIINEISSEVNSIFKEYEQMSNLTEFNSFSKKIQDIISKVLDKSTVINMGFIKNEFRKKLCLFENDPFVYIEKEVNDTIKKMVPTVNGDYYIPYNPYLEAMTKKGYNAVYSFDKVQEHIKKYKDYYQNLQKYYTDKANAEYHGILKLALQEINDYPIQFCKETVTDYFYGKLFDELVVYPNSIKNIIIFEAINNGLKPHTEEYDKDILSLLASKCEYKNDIIKYYNRWNYLNDLRTNFLSIELVSRTAFIKTFIENWKSLIFKNTNLSKQDKKKLSEKYNIVESNIDNFTDASIIRFRNFVKEFNGGGSANLKGEFAASFSDESFLPMLVNLVDMELTILVNELETVKFVKNKDTKKLEGFILNDKKYANIINNYFNILGELSTTKSNTKSKSAFTLALEEPKSSLKTDEDIMNIQMQKINTLYTLVENFNKQYNYRFKNIKTNIKNFIQKLKF